VLIIQNSILQEVQENRGEENVDDLQSDERGTADFDVVGFETDVRNFYLFLYCLRKPKVKRHILNYLL